jgi:hypothetical protein
MYGRDEKYTPNFRRKTQRERSSGRPRRRWKIILDWILRKKIGNLWTGFIWLRIGTNSSLLVNMAMNLRIP